VSELVRLSFPAKPDYLLLARLALTGIARDIPMSDELLSDLKLAVTEACGNSVRHAYPGGDGSVSVAFALDDHSFHMIVEDQGTGIDSADLTRESRGEGGMGMSIIQTIVDDVAIGPGADGRGTVVRMTKRLETED
jgi:serine/threonine-protein kinase RsbW